MSNTQIKFEDIRKGDTIRVEWTYDDMQLTRTAKVDTLRHSDWLTEAGNTVTVSPREQTIYLIDRPKPKLPTEPGTIIYSQMPTEAALTPLILRDSDWWKLDGRSYYLTHQLAERPWKLAKVVEA